MSTMSDDIALTITAKDAGAAQAFTRVGKSATDAQKKTDGLSKSVAGMRQTFGRLTAQLGTATGGAFAPLIDTVGVISDAFDGMSKKIPKAQKALIGIGLAGVGVGAMLTQMGVADQQATAQLAQAIENTGASFSDYEDKVAAAEKAMYRFGRESEDTDAALQKLTTATGDPQQALDDLGTVADLAAAKNTSLATAADTLIKAFGGNAKVFAQFGIHLDGVGSKSEQTGRALKQLQDRLSGQAAAKASTFGGQLEALKTTLAETVEGFAHYGPALTAVSTATTVVAAAWGTGAKALGKFSTALKEAGGAMAGMEAAAAPLALAILPITAALILFQKEAAHTREVAAGAREEFAKNPAVLDQWKTSLQAVDAAQGPVIRGYKTHGTAAQDLKTKIDAVNGSTKEQKAAADQAATAMGFKSAADKDAADKADLAAKALERENTALYANLDAALAVSGSTVAVDRAINNLSKSVKDNGKSFEGTSEKALNNKDALNQAMTAARAHEAAVFKQTGSIDRSSAAFDQQAAAIYQAGIKAGFSKSQMDAYFRSIGLIPPKVVTTVDANTGVATQKITVLQSELDKLQRDRNIFLDVFWRVHGVPPSGITGHPMQAGGPVSPDQLYMVGERGPELFVPNTPGTIIPNSQLRSPGTVNISVNVSGAFDRGTGADAGRAIVEQIRQYERRSGTGWRN